MTNISSISAISLDYFSPTRVADGHVSSLGGSVSLSQSRATPGLVSISEAEYIGGFATDKMIRVFTHFLTQVPAAAKAITGASLAVGGTATFQTNAPAATTVTTGTIDTTGAPIENVSLTGEIGQIIGSIAPAETITGGLGTLAGSVNDGPLVCSIFLLANQTPPGSLTLPLLINLKTWATSNVSILTGGVAPSPFGSTIAIMGEGDYVDTVLPAGQFICLLPLVQSLGVVPAGNYQTTVNFTVIIDDMAS